MLRQKMMLALVGTALLTLPAFGQGGSGGMNQPAPGATSNQAQSGASSGQQAGAQASGQFVNQAQPGQWRGSKLTGLAVYGPNNERIGDINDVLLDKSGKAETVVIGVGGFLGIGEKNVGLPWSAVQWLDQPARTAGTGTTGTGADRPADRTTTASAANRDYPDHAMITMTKDQLQNAPAFRYASDTSDRSGTTRDTGRPASPPAASPPPAGSPPAGSPNR
jgi:sporulation protein YlmC with PRC-barrel domain